MELCEVFKDNGIQMSDKQIEQFELYANLLVEWNEKFNLTAITEKDDIYIKHFLDCLILQQYPLDGTVCDIGTGAGFPAIVLKIAIPQLDITMLEPNGKKVTFLNEVIRQLDLHDIRAINVRSEEYAMENRECFDVVTARAVAPMNILSELAMPLVKVGGHFISMKGPKAEEELSQTKAVELLGGAINSVRFFTLNNDSTRVIIDIVKIKETTRKYPRNYSQIKKKPL